MSCTFWMRRKRIAAQKRAAQEAEVPKMEQPVEKPTADNSKTGTKPVKKAVAKDDNEGTV